MKSIGQYRAMTSAALLAMGLLLPISAAVASPERLEADLQRIFDGSGTLTIGDVSSPMLSLGERAVAEGVVYEGSEDERILIDSYTVRGDYDAPDAVEIEGLRVENRRNGSTVLDIGQIRFDEPSHAVFPFDDAAMEWHTRGLAIDHLAVDLTSEVADEMFRGSPLAGGSGRVKAARIEGRDLAPDRIGRLEASDLAGEGRNLGELGSGSFRLASLLIEDAYQLDDEDEARVGSLLLGDMTLDSERMVGAFEQLRLDGDMDDGEGGMWLDGLSLDLDRMIAQAPPEQRSQLRMIGNVLTDGTGKLDLDAVLEARWRADAEGAVVLSQSVIDIADGLRLALDTDLPVEVPDGVEPSEYLAGLTDLEDVVLRGGDIHLQLENRGLFGRIAPVGAAMSGVSEQQFIEQTRTQAQGFGMMLGKDVQTILLGLVGMLEGDISELTISATLPADSDLESYRDDPLGATERMAVRVETR